MLFHANLRDIWWHLICTFYLFSRCWRTRLFQLFLEESWRNKHHLYNENLFRLFSGEQMLSSIKSKRCCTVRLYCANHEHGFFNKKRPVVGMWYVFISTVQSYIHFFLNLRHITPHIYTHIRRINRKPLGCRSRFHVACRSKIKTNQKPTIERTFFQVRKTMRPKDFGLDAMPKAITLSNFFSFLEVPTNANVVNSLAFVGFLFGGFFSSPTFGWVSKWSWRTPTFAGLFFLKVSGKFGEIQYGKVV